MNFTAHNILLDNGQRTMGEEAVVLANSAVWTAIAKTVNFFMPQSMEQRSHSRVVDLGCLEGGFAVEFARMGFDTLGIEARAENIQSCNYVQSNVTLPNLHFIQDDVRNLPGYGKFDITFCSGLLYHLNDPVQFLKQISDCTTKLLILNTHYAPEHDFRYDAGFLNKYFIAPVQKRIKSLRPRENYRLSKITTNEGYRGRWFKEWSENTKKEEVEKILWASYNNHRSFWLTKKELTKALHHVGFTSVFEQFDFTGDLWQENFTEYHSRTMFVAIKH